MSLPSYNTRFYQNQTHCMSSWGNEVAFWREACLTCVLSLTVNRVLHVLTKNRSLPRLAATHKKVISFYVSLQWFSTRDITMWDCILSEEGVCRDIFNTIPDMMNKSGTRAKHIQFSIILREGCSIFPFTYRNQKVLGSFGFKKPDNQEM